MFYEKPTKVRSQLNAVECRLYLSSKRRTHDCDRVGVVLDFHSCRVRGGRTDALPASGEHERQNARGTLVQSTQLAFLFFHTFELQQNKWEIL
jgi:hypothetical protein